jgi:hypothetical protein
MICAYTLLPLTNTHGSWLILQLYNIRTLTTIKASLHHQLRHLNVSAVQQISINARASIRTILYNSSMIGFIRDMVRHQRLKFCE